MGIFYDNPALENYWYPLATEVELSEGPVGRTLLGRAVVLYRDPDGAIVAAPDRCPHREAPLSAGTLDNGVLSCCYHGWAFGAAGRCVAIPSADADFPIPNGAHLSCVATTTRYGLVWVCLGEDPPAIPCIVQEEDAAFRRINNPVEPWQVSATRMTDNFLDIAHFPWVHVGTFGNRQRTRVPDIELDALDDDFYGYAYPVVAENPDGANLTSGQNAETVSRDMTTGFNLPFTVRSTIAYASGLRHILLLLPVPIDDITSYFTFVVWRNDDFSISAEDMIRFDRMIGQEDKAMLEKLSGVLPLGPQDLANTRSDKPSVAWRHQFAKLLGVNLKAATG
jgi:phenylpropionate dioxygenase-like ring-hydroxylating dioxygenase large terminal subunit